MVVLVVEVVDVVDVEVVVVETAGLGWAAADGSIGGAV